ncbi:MAG: tryptophan--tRNA ligase [Candidatus Hydrothermarchaeota archaeon]|jgi:tryptophanyl-tRNA synthetase|nr:tryptophan--tRNA ligase [Candidatus Hydrothermarchaeota archaeon]MDP6612936.1 tryptophan--tRNA ligase [Candidatus Hydrothermarchaeota archaeon]
MPANDFVVTPWEVTGKVDYEKLVERFGTQIIDDSLLERIRRHAGELHFMLRRGIFYSHRDLGGIMNEHEKGNEFVLYTGRGPSGSTHLGHLMPWIFTKYLQDSYGAKLLFQLTDDEKFLFNEAMSHEDTKRYAYENALDIIALGFDAKKTEIFLDTEYITPLYEIALRVAKRVTFSTAKAVFGFKNSTNIGSIFFTSIQSVPAFLESQRQGRGVPCLIPCAIDQDPHFRVTRDVASALGYPKPALIHCKFFPSLAGSDKMSASKTETSIFTTDTPEVAGDKIMNAFTGGGAAVREQREKGGKPVECSIYQYYYYVFEEDDEKVAELSRKCKEGEMICGECKALLAERVKAFLRAHQRNREKAKDRLEEFMLRD